MICFHHDDLDGMCSGAIVKKSDPSAKCYAVNYINPFPVDKIKKGDTVVISDFTPETPELFKKIIEAAGGEENVIWLDHHKKNIDEHPELNKRLKGKRSDLKPSGAMLTWQYFFPNERAPKAVVYVSDFDTWTHKYPESRLFEAGMSSVPHKPQDRIWQRLLNYSENVADGIGAFASGEPLPDNIDDSTLDIINRGRIVQEYKKEWAKDYLDSHSFETEFDGHKTLACNIAHCGSDFFESKKDPKYKLLMPFAFQSGMWSCSLYSEDGSVDCAEIASKHGGGGHKGASGFSSKEFPFKV